MKKTDFPVSRKWSKYLDRFPKARVLVLGDIMHDVFIWGRVERISPEAPVPVVEVTRETTLLGGAANVANNIAALGAKPFLAGVIGSDAPGDQIIKSLQEIRADYSCLRRSKTRPTPVKTRIIAHQQQVVRFDKEEKRPIKPSTFNALWRSLKTALPRVDAVIVSDYAKGLVTEQLMAKLREACRRENKILAVDPKPEHMEWYRGAHVITPNHKEAAAMAGFPMEREPDLERGGRLLLQKLQCQTLVITRGEKGMSIFQPGKTPVHIPARAREVFDVTGAGDTVVAALVVALVSGMSAPEAAALANLAAGIVVGKLGTSTATLEEIKQALKNPQPRNSRTGKTHG